MDNQQQENLNNMKVNWKIVDTVDLTLKSGRIRKSYLIECKCGYQRYIHLSEWARIQNNTHTSNLIQNGCRRCNILDKSIESKTQAIYKRLLKAIESSCKRKGREFNLSIEQAINIYKSNCYYCNTPPSNIFKSNNIDGFTLKYTGVDRVDSSKGYTIDNVVPACIHCNRAKNDLGQKEFYNLISRIYSFRVQRLGHVPVDSSESK